MHQVLMTIFRRCLGDALLAQGPWIAQDLFSIIHGMVDAAGQRGERDLPALTGRVERAVFGYLKTYS